MSNHLRIALIGAGYMGQEYSKVLKAQNVNYFVVCRTMASADKFEEITGVRPKTGGIDKAFESINYIPDKAIVAVNVDQLASTVINLAEKGVKEILVEKPAGMNRKEIQSICDHTKNNGVSVYVAYNRRFYASTEKALEIIKEDGGVDSFNFEFTEWGHTIEATNHPSRVKEEWMLANSSHVIDLAFYFGGKPVELSSYISGSLSWHKRASKYAGAGITDKGATFSYQANWDAPGRWAVEVLTKEHRLYLKPMEKLQVQNKGSVIIEDVPIDDSLDVEYKPGLFKQVEAFLKDNHDDRLLSIDEQLKHLDFYEKIEGLR